MVSGVYFTCNCFTFIPVVVFIITVTFIKVVRNKCLNGTFITTIRVVIHPLPVRKLSGKSGTGVHDKRHNTIYLDYSQVLNTQQQVIALVSDYSQTLKRMIGSTCEYFPLVRLWYA